MSTRQVLKRGLEVGRFLDGSKKLLLSLVNQVSMFHYHFVTVVSFRHYSRLIDIITPKRNSSCLSFHPPLRLPAAVLLAHTLAFESGFAICCIARLSTMKGYDTPLVDDQNPLYCPSIPAVSFLESIRQQLHEPSTANVTHTSNRSPSSDDYMLPSFARLLDKSVTADDLLELLYHPPGLKFEDSDSSTSSELNDNTEGSMVLAGLDAPVKQADSFGLPETFSDIKGPVKREMSQASMNEGSFELSAKADRLLYFVRGGSYSPYPAKSRRYPHRPPRNQNHEWRVKVYELQDRIYILEGL